MPRVSVIIPCYNREKYIAQTVDSVFEQSYPDIELIVVDDGCTDGSRDVLESYSKRLRILEHPGRVNRGQSAAINLGLAVATGEYIAVLDSDDLFSPDKIKIQTEYLNSNPTVGFVYANGMIIDDSGRQEYLIFPPGHLPPDGPEPVLLNCFISLPSNALVRRVLYEKAGGFDVSLRAAQDHDMLLRLLEISSAGYIDKCLWSYRRHGESISRNGAIDRWRNGYKILNKARYRYRYRITALLGRLAVLNFRLGQCYQEEGDYLKAIPLFFAAGICDPVRSMKVLIGLERISSPH